MDCLWHVVYISWFQKHIGIGNPHCREFALVMTFRNLVFLFHCFFKVQLDNFDVFFWIRVWQHCHYCNMLVCLKKCFDTIHDPINTLNTCNKFRFWPWQVIFIIESCCWKFLALGIFPPCKVEFKSVVPNGVCSVDQIIKFVLLFFGNSS